MTTTKPMFVKAGPLFDWECTIPAEPAPAPARPPANRADLLGRPCTVEQLAEYICDRAGTCPHAQRCAAQPVGADAKCFRAIEQQTPKAKRTRRKLAPQDSTGKAGLEHLLRQREVPYVAVDEAKKAIFAGSSLEAFDFLVYCDDGPNHLVLIVHGRPTVEQDALLAEWEKVFGPAFVGIFARRLASGTWAYLLHGSDAPWTEYLPVDD